MKCPPITIAATAALCILTHRSKAFTTSSAPSFAARTKHALHAASSAAWKREDETRPTRDRSVDRRKSPALWRYDLDRSSSSASATNRNDTPPDDPPELMSPAGGWPQLKAAVSNGADAVYLGLTSYSARARADNFDPDPRYLYDYDDAGGGDAGDDGDEDKPNSLARAVQYCHRYNVRVYVAFNTLVFDEELREVQRLIQQIWDCGADAVIIQDVGVAKVVKEVVDRLSKRSNDNSSSSSNYDGSSLLGKGLHGAPLEIHASTQQTVTCADGVSFAAERTNATRVVSVVYCTCHFSTMQYRYT